MATLAVTLSSTTATDVSADASLVDDTNYHLQVLGGNARVSAQASAPNDADLAATPAFYMGHLGEMDYRAVAGEKLYAWAVNGNAQLVVSGGV